MNRVCEMRLGIMNFALVHALDATIIATKIEINFQLKI